jgi:hypothetical protein
MLGVEPESFRWKWYILTVRQHCYDCCAMKQL